MKLTFYVIVGLALIGLATWVMTTQPVGSSSPDLAFVLLVPVFAVAPIGAFWMMYMAIRYERHPLQTVLLAMFMPFSFVWYYFERVRKGKHLSRQQA